MNPDEFIISRHPYEVTLGQVKAWVARRDEESKKNITEFIYHRLHNRYLEPLLKIPPDYKSGFLMMAASCLLIETLLSFYKGQDQTARGAGAKSFKKFFRLNRKFFPGFADNDVDFYHNIRCGILHQAETKGGYSILRKGQLLDKTAQTIDANKFMKALDDSIDKYVNKLQMSEFDSKIWTRAIRKINYICDNCEK